MIATPLTVMGFPPLLLTVPANGSPEYLLFASSADDDDLSMAVVDEGLIMEL